MCIIVSMTLRQFQKSPLCSAWWQPAAAQPPRRKPGKSSRPLCARRRAFRRCPPKTNGPCSSTRTRRRRGGALRTSAESALAPTVRPALSISFCTRSIRDPSQRSTGWRCAFSSTMGGGSGCGGHTGLVDLADSDGRLVFREWRDGSARPQLRRSSPAAHPARWRAHFEHVLRVKLPDDPPSTTISPVNCLFRG